MSGSVRLYVLPVRRRALAVFQVLHPPFSYLTPCNWSGVNIRFGPLEGGMDVIRALKVDHAPYDSRVRPDGH